MQHDIIIFTYSCIDISTESLTTLKLVYHAKDYTIQACQRYTFQRSFYNDTDINTRKDRNNSFNKSRPYCNFHAHLGRQLPHLDLNYRWPGSCIDMFASIRHIQRPTLENVSHMIHASELINSLNPVISQESYTAIKRRQGCLDNYSAQIFSWGW